MIEKWMDFFSVPQEIDWMLSLAAGDLQTPLMEGMDWQRFAELVSKNRLEPLVAVGIKKLPQETVRRIPGSETYAKVKNSLALLSMRQIQTLACVMSDFAAHGIRALSFKGPLLALDLYGNLELRYSHDLDILIARTDFPKSCERLEANGFQEEITVLNKTEKRRRKVEGPMGIIHTKFFRGDLCIELHWKISHRIAESFDAFWERRSQKKLLGQTIHCLGDLDNISYLICHAAGHGYMRMRWLVDLYILLQRPDLNWLALYQDMKRKGIQGKIWGKRVGLLFRWKLSSETDHPADSGQGDMQYPAHRRSGTCGSAVSKYIPFVYDYRGQKAGAFQTLRCSVR